MNCQWLSVQFSSGWTASGCLFSSVQDELPTAVCSVQFISVQDELPTAVCSVQFKMNCQRLSVCGQCYLCLHGHLQDRNNNDGDDDDRVYTTLEQTRCAFVTCVLKE